MIHVQGREPEERFSFGVRKRAKIYLFIFAIRFNVHKSSGWYFLLFGPTILPEDTVRKELV